MCDYGTGHVIWSPTSAPAHFTYIVAGQGHQHIQRWASKWALYREVCSGFVWLRVYVTVKQHSLIHKQQATNRAAILWENHWGGRWGGGGGGCGAQRAGCLTAATFPSLFWFDSSEANENQAHEAPGYQGRNAFLELMLPLWNPTPNLKNKAHKKHIFAKM